MTTNCIQAPTAAYADRIFTPGEVGVVKAAHLPGGADAAAFDCLGRAARRKDFGAVIKRALELPGFTDADVLAEPRFVTTGFGHAATLSVAGDVLAALKDGSLKHIYLIGGCDAPEPSRKSYTEVAEGLPQDSMILTKFRFIDHDFGALPNGLPRLLDMGQW